MFHEILISVYRVITFDFLCWPFSQIPDWEYTFLVDDFTLAASGAAGTAVIAVIAVIAASKIGLKCQAVGGVDTDLMGDLVQMGSMPFRVERNDLISSWPERTDGRADG